MSRAPRSLDGQRVALLVADGYERSELEEPQRAIREAGGEPVVITPDGDDVRGWSGGDWSGRTAADCSLDDAVADHFDALVLPGGVLNPDTLRADARAVAFVRAFVALERPVAAICHGPWTLIDAGAVLDRTVTSWPSLRADLENAGAIWVDQEVVVDGDLITSRKPDDLQAFCAALVARVAARGPLEDRTAAK